MIPPEPSSALHKLHAENNQRLRPVRNPPVTAPSIRSCTGEASSMAAYNTTKRSRAATASPTSDRDRRDSHDLSLSPGRGRESLVDNLLLSFDKLGDGSLGAFDGTYFSSLGDDNDDDDDSASNYSQTTRHSLRGTRSNSVSNYHQTLASLSYGGRQLSSAVVDYGNEGYGLAYDGRDTRSRGRGMSSSSSHGYGTGAYDPYEAAPPPSIRNGPRNRTPSPPRSPRLVRRTSNKSTKSTRRDKQQILASHFDEPIALPPLPAFVNATPAKPNAESIMSSTKSNGRPGFFRRVFGVGGSNNSGSSSSNNNNNNNSINANAKSNTSTNSVAREPSPPAQVPEITQTITKKASFFRRRKKSVSDAITQPSAPLPIQTAEATVIDPSNPSPVTSLRAAMNPYLRSPVKLIGYEPQQQQVEDREPAYLQRDATIRTVASSDPVSPRRPAFFGDSAWNRDSGSHYPNETADVGKKYKKETKYIRGGDPVPSLVPRSPLVERGDWERPQTSPHSPDNQTFSEEGDEKEMHWPPSKKRQSLSTRRSVDNVALERERQNSIPYSFKSDKPRQISVSKELQIATVQDIELQHALVEKQRKGSRTETLELDTQNLCVPEETEPDSSWLAAQTPASVGTPTVMLQKDGPGEQATLLEEDEEDDDDEDDSVLIEEELEAKSEDEPTSEDRELARKIFDGDEEFVTKAGAAAWLGEAGPAAARARKAYMEMFNWKGMNILSCLRMLCSKLIFRGETQQVDRIMDAISKRWCECNPNHGFKSSDIVHTVLYSALLLNTDLHMADLPQKMTRGQFIKNTMTTIRNTLAEAPPPQRIRHNNTMPAKSKPVYRVVSGNDSSSFLPIQANSFPATSKERKRAEVRQSMDFVKDFGKGRKGSVGASTPRVPEEGNQKSDYEMDGVLALVNAPLAGGIKVWETQVEIILKDFYSSVKANALPLHGSQPQEKASEPPNSLTVFGNQMLRRSPSNVSKAASDISVGNRNRDSKLGAKWTTKNKSRPRLYHNGSYAGSSRTSLEDRSMWSPSASSTWSKYSLDKTQTSMSVDSLNSAFTHSDYQQSIGFANALSHAIIREEAASSIDDRESTLLDDDELELAGAPWAKEGLVKHKHHLEAMDKKARNRGWTECFAVIEKGCMRLFQFPSKTSKAGQGVAAGGVVGGGNWSENADAIGTFMLRQTIASALPPPGYSKARPNVWALSLPSGAVHFFEVGTTEIVREFVSTANYWSARLSKEPLTGGISNVEYGWGDCIIGLTDLDTGSPPPTNHGEPRPSLQMSIRSSIDHGAMMRPRLPGDKINIKDWSPPAQSMMASSLGEVDQLKALENYVANIEAELSRHNELRAAMLLAFSPRHPNASKAMNNWEKKSSYLLREIIKFRTYIECLSAAATLREKLRAVGEGSAFENDEVDQIPIPIPPAQAQAQDPATLDPDPTPKPITKDVNDV
ncbi:hypothetical protein RUND412_008777 [Rhizina undulata]